MNANVSTNKDRYRITTFVNPSGQEVFRVTGWTVENNRIRENFKTYAEASGRKQELENIAINAPTDLKLQHTRLTPAQLSEAELAYAELDGKAPLLVAVRWYRKNYRQPITGITVDAAFDQFMEEKKRQNCRPASLTNLESKNASLKRAYGARMIGELLPEQVTELIFTKDRSPVSQDNVRRGMGVFLNWCVDKGYLAASPLAKVKPVKTDREEPTLLPLADVRKLMAAAAGYKDGTVLPYTAIAIFAGIRPTELGRITWEDIDLKSKAITISAKIAKMRGRRIVELSRNLVDWLKPFALAKTPIVGPNWRRDFETVRQLAGYCGRKKKDDNGNDLKPWTPDIMRHTGVSYHLAEHQHEGKTATWAGNSPDVIQKHYRNLVSQKDVKAFWKIGPDNCEAIKLPEPKTDKTATLNQAVA